jgi:HTH-type transcriptional regulator/antitoxin HigA
MTRISVEPFPPGEYIQDELDARGWTQDDLADVMHRTRQHIGRLIKGQTAIGPETASELAAAFGTSAEMWMNLQTSYELSKAVCDEENIARRAALYASIPVREMRKRNWIPGGDDVAALESDVCRFLGVSSLNDEPAFSIAARKSTSYESHTWGQIAWGCRARQLAERVGAAPYVDGNIDAGMPELLALAANPRDIRRVPAVLASMGIRLVIVQHLQSTKIDGGAMWIDDHTPVIALSLRYGRIDNFWHNLVHELIHIKYRDKPVIDVGLNEVPGEGGGEIEERANREAATHLIPPDKLESFIARNTPLFYQSKVIQFANARGVHPGIVAGQLQRRTGDYTKLRKLQVDIRQQIIGMALTDGWGDCPIGT